MLSLSQLRTKQEGSRLQENSHKEPNRPASSSWTSKPLEVRGNVYLLFKPRGLWHFVTAARADRDTSLEMFVQWSYIHPPSNPSSTTMSCDLV